MSSPNYALPYHPTSRKIQTRATSSLSDSMETQLGFMPDNVEIPPLQTTYVYCQPHLLINTYEFSVQFSFLLFFPSYLSRLHTLEPPSPPHYLRLSPI